MGEWINGWLITSIEGGKGYNMVIGRGVDSSHMTNVMT